MSARKMWFAVGAAAALLLVPLIAIGQMRAIRQSGLNCYLSGGAGQSMWVDLASTGGLVHDWGLGSKDKVADANGVLNGGTIFCPVPLDVPRSEANSIERVNILYSTRDMTGANPSITPKIENCSAYLMDGTSLGTWVGSANPSMGGPTTTLYDNGMITIEGATAKLGSSNLRRMVITCTMPQGVRFGTSANYVYSALVRAYEVQYLAAP
jgi:hypothetical protein